MRSLLSLLGGLIITFLFGCVAWKVLDVYYRPDDGRVLTGWTYLERGAPYDQRYLRKLQSKKSDAAVRDSSGKEVKGAGRLLDFGPLSLRLGLQAPSTNHDRAESGIHVCNPASRELDLTFQYYSSPAEARIRRRFKLLALVDGQERWSTFYPSGEQPKRVVISSALRPGKCSNIGFMVMPLDSSQGDSWETASRVEIFYPRLIPAGSYDSLPGLDHH